MSNDLDHHPIEIEFDDEPGTGLAPLGSMPPEVFREPAAYTAQSRSPFVDYAKVLTSEGGIAIYYKDLWRSGLSATLRTLAWLLLTGLSLWLLQNTQYFPGSFVAAAALAFYIVTRKIKRRHSIEIRHDRMILDNKDVFWAKDIGLNWPQVQIKDPDDPDCMIVAGILGTRWVEYATCNRCQETDKTPEVLAADLNAAMQQLWGRAELDFG